MHNLKELIIWQKAVDLSIAVYKITQQLPEDEKFGLTSQMRRSAISISSNVAEGAGRNSDKEFSQFLGLANGSSQELFTQAFICFKLNFITESDFQSLEAKVNEIQKMIYSLKDRLKSNLLKSKI
jgi:four helix bundle protein